MISNNCGAKIIGTGSYLPANRFTNEEVIKKYHLDTNDSWIIKNLGITSRCWADPDEQCSDLAVKAARSALDSAGILPTEIGGIILAPGYGDRLYPATAPIVAHKLGAINAFAFDVQSACIGFLVGLQIGRRFISMGSHKYILVIGADVGSRGVKYSHADRTLGVIFGDGAGAAVLARDSAQDYFLEEYLMTDGSTWHLAGTLIGGSECPITPEAVELGKQYGFMEGSEILKTALTRLPQAVHGICDKAKIALDDVDFFVFHQANLRILERVLTGLEIPMEKTHTTIQKCGNLGNPSIALTLDEAVRSGKIRSGNLVCMVGVGAGITWGASLIRWA